MTNGYQSDHWADQQERGTPFFLRVTAMLVRHSPAWFLRVCIWVVVAYFYTTGSRQRRFIGRYQARLRTAYPGVMLPRYAPIWRQFLAFGEALTDRFAVWQKKITYADLVVEDEDDIYADIRRSATGGAGQVMVCSHVGNVEICRALVHHHRGFVLNVLVHSQHAVAFNQALKKAGADDIHLIQVTDLDASLMLSLQHRLCAGQWIAIAADRVPVRGEKTVEVDFLGHPASMPQGPWLLAGLLKAPLVSVCCTKRHGRYHLCLSRFNPVPAWRKHERSQTVAMLAQRFADKLGEQCALVPLQWFNFYDFWGDEANDKDMVLPLSDHT